jgi:phage shock protein PspC (stress-responsive transcriptional regulator)
MSAQDYKYQADRFKRMLGTAAERGWVFGVCPAVAQRTGFELWCVRLTAIICLLVFTLPTVAIYFAAAMVMPETRPGAQSKLKRWASRADALVDALKDNLAGRSQRQA